MRIIRLLCVAAALAAGAYTVVHQPSNTLTLAGDPKPGCPPICPR